MAAASTTLQVLIDGSTTGLIAAVSAAQLALRGLDRGTRGIGRGAATALPLVAKGMAAISAASSAITVVAGLGSALAAAAPAALILPGILLGVAAVVGTLKLAFSGMGEAISAADPAAFAEATKNMAPAAVETASAIRALKPAFEDLKKSVQGEFFRGFATQIERTGAVLLPLLRTGLTGLAGPLGEMGRQAIEAARAPFFQSDLTQILNNTRGALVGMEGVVANLLSGFVGLGAVGSEYLPAIGQAAGDAAARFAEWVDAGASSGTIADAIDRALIVLRQFGEVAGNVGAILGSIFTGLSAGDSSVFLDGLVEVTGALREFFAAAESQTALAGLGEAMRAVSAAVGQILLAALQAVTPIITALAPLVAVLAQALSGALVPALAVLGPPITALVQALVGALAPVLPVIADLFAQLAAALAPVLAAAAPIVALLGSVLAPVLAALAPVVAAVANILGQTLTAALQVLEPVLAQLVPPVILFAQTLGGLLLEAVNALAPIIPVLAAALAEVLAAVAPLIPIILDLATTVIRTLIDAFVSLVPVVLPVVTALLSIGITVIQVAVPVVQFVVTVIAAITNLVVTVLSAIANFVVAFVGFFVSLASGVIAVVGGFVTGVLTFFSTLASGLITAVSNAAVAVIQFFRNMVTDSISALTDFVNRAVQIGRDIIGGIVNGLRAAGGAVVDFLVGLATDALNAVKNFLGIASPSRVFRDQVGRQMGAGLAAGIRASTGGVIAEARALSDAAVTAARAPITALPAAGAAAAARELLGRVQGGAQVFEDLSFRGASANLSAFNDDLSRAFEQQGGGRGADLEAFLIRYLARQDERPASETRVFIGERELTDIVRVEVGARDRSTVRTVYAGGGVSL